MREAQVERLEYTQLHMGVETRIAVWAPRPLGDSAARAAFARIAVLDSLLSDYRPDSDVSRVSDGAGGPAVPASRELITVLSRALEVASASGGAFDPTVGALTRLWREARRARVAPDSAAVAEALRTVGWADVRMDADAGTITLARPGTRLDLGGIAKGHAIDEALAVLREHGIERALVHMGGDVGVMGTPPEAAGWSIVLPGQADTLRISGGAVAVSGPTEQFLEIDGTRHSHVIDPRTGFGVTASDVTIVLAADAMLADALATAVGVLDPAGRFALRLAYPQTTFAQRRP